MGKVSATETEVVPKPGSEYRCLMILFSFVDEVNAESTAVQSNLRESACCLPSLVVAFRVLSLKQIFFTIKVIQQVFFQTVFSLERKSNLYI